MNSGRRRAPPRFYAPPRRSSKRGARARSSLRYVRGLYIVASVSDSAQMEEGNGGARRRTGDSVAREAKTWSSSIADKVQYISNQERQSRRGGAGAQSGVRDTGGGRGLECTGTGNTEGGSYGLGTFTEEVGADSVDIEDPARL